MKARQSSAGGLAAAPRRLRMSIAGRIAYVALFVTLTAHAWLAAAGLALLAAANPAS